MIKIVLILLILAILPMMIIPAFAPSHPIADPSHPCSNPDVPDSRIFSSTQLGEITCGEYREERLGLKFDKFGEGSISGNWLILIIGFFVTITLIILIKKRKSIVNVKIPLITVIAIIIITGTIGSFLIIFSFPEQTGIVIVSEIQQPRCNADIDPDCEPIIIDGTNCSMAMNIGHPPCFVTILPTTLTCSDNGWFWGVGDTQWSCLDGIIDGGYGLRSGSEIKSVLDVTSNLKSLDGKLVFVNGVYLHLGGIGSIAIPACFVDRTVQGELREGYQVPLFAKDVLIDKTFEGFKVPTDRLECEADQNFQFVEFTNPNAVQEGVCTVTDKFAKIQRSSRLEIKAIDPEIPYINLTPNLTDGESSIVAGELKVSTTSAGHCTTDTVETATLFIYQKYLGIRLKVPIDTNLIQRLCLTC